MYSFTILLIENFLIQKNNFKNIIMAKSQDAKKNVKKEPQKTAKEKRAEKRAKKLK